MMRENVVKSSNSKKFDEFFLCYLFVEFKIDSQFPFPAAGAGRRHHILAFFVKIWYYFQLSDFESCSSLSDSSGLPFLALFCSKVATAFLTE